MRFFKNKLLLFVSVLVFFLTSFTTKVESHTEVAIASNNLDAIIAAINYQSSYANRNIVLSVLKGRTQEEAWEIVLSVVGSYFDVFESEDERSGYLRTGWVGTNFDNNTKRVRVIIRKKGSSSVKYSLKFVSQESGEKGTSYTDDQKYTNINTIPNSYDGFIDELMSMLKY